MLENITLNTPLFEEDKDTTTSFLENKDPSYASFINTLVGLPPAVLTVEDEATPSVIKPAVIAPVDNNYNDFILNLAAPAIEMNKILGEEEAKSEGLSFLSEGVNKKQYAKMSADLEAWKKYNPEEFTKFNTGFNEKYLQQFRDRAIPENTLKLFSGFKELLNNSDVIATPNGYGTLFSILMESQLKTKDQIDNTKSDFYYLTNDKDFRDKVIASVKDEDTKGVLQDVLNTMDKDNDESVSTLDKLMKRPNDKTVFNRSFVQNMVQYGFEAVRLLSGGKSLAGLAVAATGTTGLAAGAVSLGVGTLVSGAMMASMGAFFQNEEERKTKGQIEVVDMMLKVKSGDYTQKQVDAAVIFGVKAEYVDPLTGELLKSKLDTDVEAGIETGLTTAYLTPDDIHQYNLNGGLLSQPRRDFDYSWVESFGDMTGEVVGSAAITALKASKGGLRPLLRGNNSSTMIVGAVAMTFYRSVKQNYIFDVLQGFTIPALMQNEILSNAADYNFLFRPLVYQALNYVPNKLSHKLAGITFGNIANLSKSQESALANDVAEFNSLFNLNCHFMKGLSDNLNTSTKELTDINSSISKVGADGVTLKNYDDLNAFVKSGGLDTALAYEKIVSGGDERLKQIETSRELRTLGSLGTVKDLDSSDGTYVKDLLGIDQKFTLENADVDKTVRVLASDFGDDSSYTGKTVDGVHTLIKTVNLMVNAKNEDGDTVQLKVTKDLTVDDLKTILTTYFKNDTTEAAITDKITKLENYSKNFSNLRNGLNIEDATKFFTEQGFDSSQITKLKIGDFTKESINSFSGVLADTDLSNIKTLLAINYGMAAPARAKDGVVSIIRQSIYNTLKFNGQMTVDPAHKISTAVNLASNTVQVFENTTKLAYALSDVKKAPNVYRNVYSVLKNAFNAIEEFKDYKLASGEDSTVLFKGSVEEFNKALITFRSLDPDTVSEKDVAYLKSMLDTFKGILPMIKHDLLTDYGSMLSDIAKLSSIIKNPEQIASSLQPGEEASIIESLFISKDYETEVKPIIDEFTNNGAATILNKLNSMTNAGVNIDPNIMSRFSIFKTLGWDDYKTVGEAVDGLHAKFETLKTKFPEMFEDGSIDLNKLQEKLNNAVSLQDFTNKVNMNMQARGFIAVNPSASAASVLDTVYKISDMFALIDKNSKAGIDNTDNNGKLNDLLKKLPYIFLMKGEGVNSAADIAHRALTEIPAKFGTGSIRYIFNKLKGMTETSVNNPLYKLVNTGVGGSNKDAAMMLGVDNLVSDAIHKAVLKVFSVDIPKGVVTDSSDIKNVPNFKKIFELAKQDTPIKDIVHNEESRKAFLDTIRVLVTTVGLDDVTKLIETAKAQEGLYINYTKAYQLLITSLGTSIKDAIVKGVYQDSPDVPKGYKNKAYVDEKAILEAMGINISKMEFNSIDGSKVGDTMASNYIIGLVKAAGITKKLRDSIESSLSSEIDAKGNASEYLKSEIIGILGEEYSSKINKMTGDQLVKHITTLYMHHINEKQVYAAYEAFGFGASNDSAITMKQVYNNVMDVTSNAPLKLLLTQFSAVTSHDALIKNLLASISSKDNGTFNFSKKLAIITQTLSDYREIIDNFKNSPILRSIPDELTSKLMESVDYGFNKIASRVNNFSEAYKNADSIKKEALLVSAENYFKNLSNVFDITSHVTSSFVNNMTSMSKQKDGILSDSDISKALMMSLQTVNTLNINSVRLALYSADNVLSNNSILATPYRHVRHTWLSLLNSGSMKSLMRNVADPYYGLSSSYKSTIKRLDNERSDLFTELSTAFSLVLNANDPKSMRVLAENLKGMFTAAPDTEYHASLISRYSDLKGVTDSEKIEYAKKNLIADVLGLKFNEDNAVDMLTINNHYNFINSAAKAGVLDIILDESVQYTTSRDYYNAQKLNRNNIDVKGLDVAWSESLESKIRDKVGESGLREFKITAKQSMGEHTNTADSFSLLTLAHSEFVNNIMYNSIYNDKLFGFLKDTSPRMFESVKQTRGVLKKVAGYGIMNGEIGAYSGKETPMEKLRMYALENGTSSREKLASNPMYIQKMSSTLQYYATMQDDVILSSFAKLIEGGNDTLSTSTDESVLKLYALGNVGRDFVFMMDPNSDSTLSVAKAAMMGSTKDSEVDPNFRFYILGESMAVGKDGKIDKSKAFMLNPVEGKSNTFTTNINDKVFSGTPDEIARDFLRVYDIAFQIRVKGNKEQLGILRKGVRQLKSNTRLNPVMLDQLEDAINVETSKDNKTPSDTFRAVITDLKDNFQAKSKKGGEITPEMADKAEIYDSLFKVLIEQDTSIKHAGDLPVTTEVSSSYLLGEKISVIIAKKGTDNLPTIEDVVKMTTGLTGDALKKAVADTHKALKLAADMFKQPKGNYGNSQHATEEHMVSAFNSAIQESTETILNPFNNVLTPYIKVNIPNQTKEGSSLVHVIGARMSTTKESSGVYSKADIVLTVMGDKGAYEMPISVKSQGFGYIDGTSTVWSNSIVKTLAKGMIDNLRQSYVAGKEAKYQKNLLNDMLTNTVQSNPNALKESMLEMYSCPAILRSFGALIKMTDFDPTSKLGLSPFTEKGAIESFNRAFSFIANNKSIYDMYLLYKEAQGNGEGKNSAVLKLAGLVGEAADLNNVDNIMNKAQRVLASEVLANEKNSNPWVSNFTEVLRDKDKMTHFTKLYLNRLLGIGGEKANAGSSVVDIYKNFMQLGLNKSEKQANSLNNTINDSIMNDLIAGPYGSVVKLDASFEPIMSFNKDPFTAMSDTIKTMFDKVKLRQWAATVSRDSGTIRILDYGGVYASPEDKAADKLSEDNGTMKVITMNDLKEYGTVGEEVLKIIEQMPEVRSKILDLIVQHEIKTSTSNVTDPDLFKETALNKFFNTFNVGKDLQDIKIGITKDFWDEIVNMKELFTPTVTGTGFGAKFLDSFQQLTSYFGVNFSGVVLITNHITWLRNLFGAYLQPSLSLGSGITGIKYSNRAIKAIIASRQGLGPNANKDIALYDEFLKFNPSKPLSLAQQGGKPYSIQTSKLDREKHHVFKVANAIINKPMEVINKGIFSSAAKLMGTDPHLLEANLRGAYGIIDDITKFAIWMAAKEGKVSAPEDWSGLSKMFNKNKALEQSVSKVYSTDIVNSIKSNGKYLRAMSSEDAARYADKFSFLYDSLPPAWSLVKNVWNPFASFTYNSMRIAANSMKTYPAKVIATYIGINLLNEGFLKNVFGTTLDFGSFVPNMDIMSHLPFSMGRPEEFTITNPSAPFMRFFRMLMEQKDPFTGQNMDNMSGLEQLTRAYITSFVPVSPTLNAALRASISLAKEGLGMNDSHIAKTGLAGTILSLMPQSYIHKKMVEQGFMGRPIDKFGTTVNPLFGVLYGVLGLNFKLEDKAKSKLIINQYMKTKKNLETQLTKLKETDLMRTNKDIQYEITSLESRLKSLADRTVSSFDDVYGEVPQNIKDAYISHSLNPVDYINAAWTSLMRGVYEEYGRSADYSIMRR